MRPPSRIRVRITLLYGTLFVVSSVILLATIYLLVAASPSDHFQTLQHASPKPGGGPAPSLHPVPSLRRQADHDRGVLLDHLLTNSGLALVVMSLVSIAVGWLFAGRILRPLRAMTATIQRISARNVHQRLAAQGPGDEIKDLSDTIDALLGRLETALDAHKRFVANAAHELRTPLTTQHALLEEALIDRNPSLASFQSNFERLLTISRQQTQLLESLLTLASSETGLDHHEPINLAELTHRVLPAYETRIQARDLRLRVDLESAWTSGDPGLVERLVANLLDNAIDYNVPQGRLDIQTRTVAGNAVFHISNTGQPIPDDRVEAIFDPFQRMDRTAGKQAHHGLGLSIVRAIASAHHATLAAHNPPEGGLTLDVVFPQRPPQPHQ